MSNPQNYEVDIKIKQRIINEAKNSNLIKHICFINFEKEMNKIYKHCDILLMPSIWRVYLMLYRVDLFWFKLHMHSYQVLKIF